MLLRTDHGETVREKFFEAMQGLAGAELRVGFFPQSKYPNKDQTPVAFVAAVHELGSPARGIPPRPFIRPAIADNRQRWLLNLASASRAIVAGKLETEVALEMFGLAVVGDIKKSISKVSAPPLSPKTVKAKRRKLADGSGATNLDKPLIETGLLLNSVNHEVTVK